MDDNERSNTADNSRKATGRPFTKGDRRINRKGRPKSFDALRELAQQIAHEETNVSGITVVEAILRQWAKSGNPQLQRAFIEVAYGKVPDRTELTGADGGAVTIRIVDATEDAHD